MKQSTCGAVICQPGGDELKHNKKNRPKLKIPNVLSYCTRSTKGRNCFIFMMKGRVNQQPHKAVEVVLC